MAGILRVQDCSGHSRGSLERRPAIDDLEPPIKPLDAAVSNGVHQRGDLVPLDILGSTGVAGPTALPVYAYSCSEHLVAALPFER